VQQSWALVIGAALLFPSTGLPCLAQAVQNMPRAASAAMEETEARAAADRILDAVRRRDGNARYAMFSEDLKQTSSPGMVQTTLDGLPKLQSWKINKVYTSLRGNSTIEITLNTSAGPRQISLVINPQGQLVAQLVNAKGQPSTQVAEAFVKAVSQGQFITARSFLSLDLQKEIPPASLQSKWLDLQAQVGTFQRIEGVKEAENDNNSKLVLVSASFTRLTDNLYLIVNNSNQIIGVDFPVDATVKPVR
jgi:hypothetical protein